MKSTKKKVDEVTGKFRKEEVFGRTHLIGHRKATHFYLKCATSGDGRIIVLIICAIGNS